MNARDRRDLIAQRVLETGSVSVTRLSAEFSLTDTSVRRDLAILEDSGKLMRVHGGAISTGRAVQMAGFQQKLLHRSDEKKRIARAALAFIGLSDVIVLDSGTTILHLAQLLPGRANRPGALRIVSNSLPLVEQIGVWASPNLLLVGGIYLPDHRATVGPEVLEQLHQISATRAFLGCDGWTAEGGFTTAHPLIAEVGRTMASRAGEVIVLTDSTKLGRAGFSHIIGAEQVTRLITDNEAPQAIVLELQARGVEVILA